MRSTLLRRGSIFLTASILVVIAIGLVGAFLVPSLVRYRGTMQNVERTRAFFLAEAALSAAIEELNSHRPGSVGSATAPIAFEDGTYYAEVVDNGDGTYTVRAAGQRERQKAGIESIAKRRFVSIWDNALIGGPGQVGQVINGNATVHGGLFVFGEQPDGSGDIGPSQVIADISGTGGVKDNYQDLSATLASKISPLSAKYPLKSEVRIKNGQVNLSGTGTLGQSTDGIDGWYSSGNIGGNQGSINVYSDNGTDRTFDIPDDVTLPSVQEPYTDVATGTQYASYTAYAAATGANLDSVFGATNPLSIVDTTPAFTLHDGPTWENSTNRIRWTPSTRTLEVDGLVYTNSSVILGTKNTSIQYKGRGTFYSGGATLEIHANLRPVDVFPTQSVLGIMSAGDINVATGAGDAQLELAAAFFAERNFTVRKQTQIAGTILARYFDMGGQVPQLFAVPALKDNLPPGWFVYDRYPASVYVVSWKIKAIP